MAFLLLDMITRTELLEKYKEDPSQDIELKIEGNPLPYCMDYIDYLRISLHKLLYDWLDKNIIYDDAKRYLMNDLDGSRLEDFILFLYNILEQPYPNDMIGTHWDVFYYNYFIKDE